MKLNSWLLFEIFWNSWFSKIIFKTKTISYQKPIDLLLKRVKNNNVSRFKAVALLVLSRQYILALINIIESERLQFWLPWAYSTTSTFHELTSRILKNQTSSNLVHIWPNWQNPLIVLQFRVTFLLFFSWIFTLETFGCNHWFLNAYFTSRWYG